MDISRRNFLKISAIGIIAAPIALEAFNTDAVKKLKWDKYEEFISEKDRPAIGIAELKDINSNGFSIGMSPRTGDLWSDFYRDKLYIFEKENWIEIKGG